jgi:hypothetical protein
MGTELPKEFREKIERTGAIALSIGPKDSGKYSEGVMLGFSCEGSKVVYQLGKELTKSEYLQLVLENSTLGEMPAPLPKNAKFFEL